MQSVDRALTLLETLAESAGGLPLTELAGRTGLNISTCHHLLATLVKWGYVAKAPGRRYALGARGLHLGQAFLKQVDLPRRAQPFVERISEETGETVHLAVLQGDAIITLLKREGRHAVRVDTGALGASDAAHATATGKAMLAWLPEDEIRRILAIKGMARLHAQHHHRPRRADRGAAAGAPQRPCHGPRGVPARRDLRRRGHPQSPRRRRRRHQRLRAHACAPRTSTSAACATA